MRVYAEDDDGNRVDITEGVQVLYDAVHASMDWGSGFLSVEDVSGILSIAVACGFLVPEGAREQYSEYAESIARYWPDRAGSREALALRMEKPLVAGMSPQRISCAECGETALFNGKTHEWEHAHHNPGHEVRLWR